MSRLHFKYSMKLYYSEPVNPCHFTIKCIPKETARQSLVDIKIEMDPRAKYTKCVDGFNNEKIIGSVRMPHDHYYLDVEGTVEIKQVLYEEEANPIKSLIYKYPFGKTIPGDNIREYSRMLGKEILEKSLIKDYDKAVYIMHSLYSDMKYQSRITDTTTTAEEAFIMRSGVCQDYAHIYIAIARSLNIPARYVTGLMIGEGQSHAWVEVLCKDKWIGLDPTNNLLIDENYIKFGHGRDAHDCKINLGIMHGGGNQKQRIDVKVWKEQ